jgi:hypothetical protein
MTYLLVIDESNASLSQGTFFLMGGLIFDLSEIGKIHHAVGELRTKYGYCPTDVLKFNVNSRPGQVSIEQFRALKDEVLTLLKDSGTKMIVYVVHHGIRRNRSDTENTKWGMQAIVGVFSKEFLARRDSFGLVTVDQTPGGTLLRSLEETFAAGVSSAEWHEQRFSHIVHLSLTASGASHLNSAVDIALGALRFCINSVPGENSELVAREILPKVVRLMYAENDVRGKPSIANFGYLQYPRNILSDQYRQEYEELLKKLNSYL